MALNKSGKVEIGTVLVWILIAGVIAYVANFGGFKDTVNGFFGSNNQAAPTQQLSGGNAPLTDTSNCPTDGTTTLTVNVQDALTTTATARYPEYYIFNGNQLIQEGVLSATDSSIDVSCGKDYDMILVNTTASSGNGIYPKVVKFKATIAQQTINDKVYRAGGAKILGIENPADPARNANVSLGASSTKQFDIKFAANETQMAFNKPIIMCQANISAITTVSLGSFSDGTPVKVVTCPSRVSPTSNYKYYCWEYEKILDPTVGVISASGSITAGASAPATNDKMSCRLVDQGPWKTASYKTSTSIEEGFKTGAENTETLVDTGTYDSAVVDFNYVHGGGY